jgi:glycosyltransferase involved in cell wall biosynthesis
VVDDGETGLLVPIAAIGGGDVEPRDPGGFSSDLANAINVLLDDPARRATMAAKARARVEEQFSWTSIARQTLDFYEATRTAFERRAKRVDPYVNGLLPSISP